MNNSKPAKMTTAAESGRAKAAANRQRLFSRTFFLHIHSPRVHLYSLRPTFTLGLGVAAACLFVVLIITGALLALHYTPSTEMAYTSVKDIIFVVPAGRIIRNMHRWAGHGLVIVTFLHLARLVYTGAYSNGRRLNWIIGIALLLTTLLFSFSGYLLPWDQLAFWAVTIGSNIAASAREFTDALGITAFLDIGGFFKQLLLGADAVGQNALTRFYMLHVIFLPISFLLLSALHFWRIRKDGGLCIPDTVRTDGATGTAQKLSLWQNKNIPAWPTALWAELAVASVVLALLLITSALFDAPLRELANPALPENPAKSPWYFLAIQELVSYSAFAGGVLIPTLFFYFLLSLPWRDPSPVATGVWFASQKGKKVVLLSALLSSIATAGLVLSVNSFGWLRNWLPKTPQLIIILINPGTLLALLFVLWALIVEQKWPSRRVAIMALFTCALFAYLILTIIALYFRGPNWQLLAGSSQWMAR